MALLLGIDTGGTFTDAVVVDDAPGDGGRATVVASAKAPTTHHDLSIGVAGAVDTVLSLVDTSKISLVSVSTTLATNALVEGHGEPAALLTFGFSANELERTGISGAVDASLLVQLDGGHDAHGNESTPIDLDAVKQAAIGRDCQ